MTANVEPSPGVQPPQPKKSGVLKWILIGGAGCALVIFLLAGGCIGAIFWGFAQAKKEPVYVQSLQKVQADPRAATALGSPIEGATPTHFNFNTTNSSETASVVYAVTGPKGSGSVSADAYKDLNNKWTFKSLTFTANGQTIDLLGSASGPSLPVEAPDDHKEN